MTRLWETDSYFSVWPWGFKKSLGKVNEDFQGRRQHDAHEFLNVLLGTLHEELNVRMVKPHIENPDNCKDSNYVVLHFWSNFLRRNWSFFVFLYYGQIQSTLRCTVCNNTRVMYEPYSNLSLPVPGSNSIQLNILVFCIPHE